MTMNLIITCVLINSLSAKPLNFVRKIAENDEIDKLENYLPKVGDLPKYRYSTFGLDHDDYFEEDIRFQSLEKSKSEAKSLKDVVDFVKDGVSAGIELFSEVKDVLSTLSPETTTSTEETTTEATTTGVKEKYEIDPVLEPNSKNATRPIRQEDDSKEVEETGTARSNTPEKESQESSEEEEEPNMVTGLISAFLGGLSRPDGSVDVEAITALLGSLSTQNADGSYNFDGLTELLMSFFGGGGEEGGGSDFGAFLGGILGAFIKGVANPPGSTGTGRFLGNLLGGLLPALSAPAPTEEGQQPAPGLDSGGFLSGLLSSLLGGIGSMSNSSNSSGGPSDTSGNGGSSFSIFKSLFSILTSILSTSSGAGAHH